MTTPTTVNVRLQLRADTAANWTAANPILLANEVGLETDTKKLKVGNGSSAWNSLAYFPSIVSGGTVLGNLEIGSTGTLTFEGSTADGFETTLAVTNPTADRTITLPNQSGTVVVSGNASIVDADIAANAEIAVSKLADGSARQLLQTDAAGTGVEWTSNVDIPGTLDVTSTATFDSNVVVTGNLTVNGTTTNINTQNLVVEDKNIILGDVATPTDVTADGGGITLKGATDKTINWVDSTDAWTSSEHINIASGKEYRIAGTKVLDATSLGGSVLITSANITDGTIVNGDINASAAIAGTKISPDFGSQTVTTTGVISAAAGAAGTPSIAFTGDLNTGIYSPGADQVAISTNGTQRINIEADGDININNGGVFYDATNNRLAIGTTSPRQALTLGGLTSSSTATPDCIDLGATYTSTSASTNLKIKLYIDSSGNTYGFTTNGNSELEYYAGTAASSGKHVFLAGGSERARIDSSGRLLVGASSAQAISSLSGFEGLQVIGTGSAAGQVVGRFTDDASGASLTFSKSRGATVGTNTVVANGDDVGVIRFSAADGTAYLEAARILAEVDGTPGTNDMPGRLVFSTTADGASSPRSRLIIPHSGASSFWAPLSAFNSSSGSGAGTTDSVFTGWYGGTSPDAANLGIISIRIWNNGNIVNTNNSYGSLSDVKLKENIVDASSQWDDLKALQVRNYNLKEGQTHTQIGLVAQEVELVSPGLVSKSPDRDAEGNDLGTVTKSVNYSVLYMKAVKALQEAMERIEQLEQRLTDAGIA